MNDNDLERRLRSESGPREDGYVASQLPASLEPAVPPSRVMRTAILAGAVVAGVLAVVVGSAMLSDGGVPENGVGAGETATPAATASPPEPTYCQPMDVELTAEPWGGAAGSRGTVVTVTLAENRYPCTIERNAYVGIFDAEGSVLISTEEEGPTDPILLRPADALVMGVSWSNWCAPDVPRPIRLVLYSLGSTFPVDVPVGADPLPPCMGEGQPSLNVTGFQPAD